MKKLMTIVAMFTLFAGALSFGYVSPASASGDDLDLGVESILTLDGETVDEGPGPRKGHRARRGARALAKACPCAGPDGPEGEAWENHEAWVQCVSDALAAAVEAGKLDQEKADKILERAAASTVGDPDHECRQPRERRERPGKPGEPEDPEL